VKTRKSGDILVSNCPVHAGDNTSAFNVNVTNGEYSGRWFCNTAGCHKEYGGDIVGLIWGLMDAKQPTSFKESIEYAAQFAGMEKFEFILDNLDDIFLDDHEEKHEISRKEWRTGLKIPSYYLDRGFTKEALDFFDVKMCEESNRAIFPIYDNTWEYVVGTVGRTVIDEKPKWKVLGGFKTSEYLFSYWSALPHICKSGKIIIVEGQGDVIRLWEAGIYNAVGIFGSELSEKQELLLQLTGAMSIITCFDNDEAGQKCRTSCDKKLHRLFNLRHVMPVGHDVGEMKPNQISSLQLNC
jgi:5S rRNA maturation endonuclease (ribonuclease M5)